MILDYTKKTATKDFFLKIIENLEKRADFADVLIIDGSTRNLRLDSQTRSFEDSTSFGIKIRAYANEQFYEVHTNSTTLSDIEDISKKLYDSIPTKRFRRKKTNVEIDKSKIKFISKNFENTSKIDPKTISIETKINLLEGCVAKVKKFNEHIANVKSAYIEESNSRVFISRDKFLSQTLKSVVVILMPFLRCSDGETRYVYESMFGQGYEVTKGVNAFIKTTCDKVMKMYDSKRLTPGIYDVILSPNLSGLLAHESFGHGMESDTVYKGRAMAKDWKGKKIAPENVSIIDDPSYPDKHGSYFFDDEGQLASPTYLVKDGIVNDYITDIFSATKMNVQRSANGRCEDYDHKNYARMSNTFFDKGQDKFENMIKDVEDGLLLLDSQGGMEDPKSWGVQIQGITAQKIEKGKLTKEIFSNISLTGFLPDILSQVGAISNKVIIEDTGFCGKGHKEWVAVSTGGPYIRIKKVELS